MGAYEQNYINGPGATTEVLSLARRQQATTGRPQWIHHHPHGHLCDHQCGPLEEDT